MTPADRPGNLHSLDSDTWRRISDALDELIDLPPEKSAEALDRLHGIDPALREQIAAILAADREVEGYLSSTARQGMMEEAAEGLDFGLPPLSGRMLGPWRLVNQIGRGGMGSVYVGERADGAFEQRVAIKFLGRGVASPELVARFRQERQILARLEHPNIARLVDGGVTEDGLWWFAMEYVEGQPITAWCEGHRLSSRAALELFQQVCRAVQYAHRNLVIHRDLKPGNILVSAAGEVKLLDFGIAKILEPEGGGATESRDGTSPGVVTAVAMTPNYASPEQIRGEAPTTTTDVYALGVVLYEILTGTRPYRLKTGALDEIRRAVLDEEPEAPSARLKRAPEGNPAVRAPRAGAGRDLGNIVLTALQKEPERRYPSVEAMSDDVQRHLEGRAVRASGRTFGYLASKFVRRNRVPVAAVVLVLLALSLGLYTTARERDRAKYEASKATELKEFALNLFRVSAPEVGRGANVTARELLDRGAQRVERELKGNPAIQAEMWDLLGSVYRSLDLFPQAIGMYRKSVGARRGLRDQPDSLLSHSILELGSSLNENGDYAEGERLMREALAMDRVRFGDTSRRVALAAGELAVLLDRMAKTAEAESLCHFVIRVDSLTVGMNSVETAQDISSLGMLLYYDGRYNRALPYLRQALAIRERLKGRRHIQTAEGIDQVAMCLTQTGELDSALTLGNEALSIRHQWLAPDHPDIAHSLMNTALTLQDLGRLDEAEKNLRESLAIRLRALDPMDPLIAHTHNDLAVVFYRERMLDSAGVHFDQALRVWAHSLPPDHRDVLTCRNNLGVVYRETGRYADSERLLREVLAERQRTLPADHMDLASTQYHLGRLLVMISRSAEAEPLLRHAIVVRREELAEDDPRVAEVELALGNGLVAMGRGVEGRALIQKCLAAAETRLGPTDRMVVLGRAARIEPMAHHDPAWLAPRGAIRGRRRRSAGVFHADPEHHLG
ncbi:MAG TPA: serine/threonine-protein kinase [Candidatus Eisenbacteria bacterium]